MSTTKGSSVRFISLFIATIALSGTLAGMDTKHPALKDRLLPNDVSIEMEEFDTSKAMKATKDQKTSDGGIFIELLNCKDIKNEESIEIDTGFLRLSDDVVAYIFSFLLDKHNCWQFVSSLDRLAQLRLVNKKFKANTFSWLKKLVKVQSSPVAQHIDLRGPLCAAAQLHSPMVVQLLLDCGDKRLLLKDHPEKWHPIVCAIETHGKNDAMSQILIQATTQAGIFDQEGLDRCIEKGVEGYRTKHCVRGTLCFVAVMFAGIIVLIILHARGITHSANEM